MSGVSKAYGEVTVLRDIQMSIAEGKITALVGANGAGKTTLFHVISGDEVTDSGAVRFRGVDVSRKPSWRRARMGIGRMFQDVRLFESLSVLENVVLSMESGRDSSPLGVWGFGPRHRYRNRETRARTLLNVLEVEPPYDRPAGSLSVGNKKLVALARLMAGGFDLWLLDEPTSGLAPIAVDRLIGLLRTAAEQQNVTIALIEHNIEFVAKVADEAFILRDGQITEHGPIPDVLARFGSTTAEDRRS